MNNPPATPRMARVSPAPYARSTVASRERARKSPSVSKATPSWVSKVPETPSPFPNHQYGRSSSRIPPSIAPIEAVPGRICHFARLPAELRNMIYSLALDRYLHPHLPNYPLAHPLPLSSLALVCRRIRHEVSYEFYRQAHINTNISHSDYSHVISWLQVCTPLQRTAMARNPNITIDLQLSLYPHWRIGGRTPWDVTRSIGNIYEVSAPNRDKFMRLGALVTWFTFISQPSLKDIKFKYRVRDGRFHYWGAMHTDNFGPIGMDMLLQQILGPFWGESGRRAQFNQKQKEAVVCGVDSIMSSLVESPVAEGTDFTKWRRRVKQLKKSLTGDTEKEVS